MGGHKWLEVFWDLIYGRAKQWLEVFWDLNYERA